jgi:nucleoside-diphosphate-sugar epimerase
MVVLMRVFVAGATGAIGRPIVKRLLDAGHAVTGTASDGEGARLLGEWGAEAAIVDALDASALKAAVVRAKPEVVINELTSLPKHYTREEMQASAERNRKLLIDGGAHLLEAAHASGARRFIAASGAYFLAPGQGLADEETPMVRDASPGVADSAHVLAAVESSVLGAADIEGAIMRYGFFYGPGSWYWPDGNVAAQMRARAYPVIGDGSAVWSFVHLEDAAEATIAALDRDRAPGIYIVTDDQPTAVNVMLPAFARWVRHPAARRIEREGASRAGLPAQTRAVASSVTAESGSSLGPSSSYSPTLTGAYQMHSDKVSLPYQAPRIFSSVATDTHREEGLKDQKKIRTRSATRVVTTGV